MLSPSDQDFLSHIGHVFLANIALNAFGSMFFGATLVIYLFALGLIRKRGSQGYATRFVVVASSVCIIGTFATFSADTYIWAINYQAFAEKSSYPPFSTWQMLAETVNTKINKGNIPAALGESLMLVISDALVIWRAQAFYPSSKLLIIVLSTILSVSSMCLLLGNILKYSSFLRGGPLIIPGDLLVSSGQTISLLVNVMTTLLVGAKLWRHRRWLNKHLSEVKMSCTPVQKKMILMVETGVAFCVVQGIYTSALWINQVWNPSESWRYTSFNVMRRFQYTFAANYTTSLLIMLQTRTSVAGSLGVVINSFRPVDQPVELAELPRHDGSG